MALSIFAILIMFLSFLTQIAISRLTPHNFMTNSFGTSLSKSKDGEGTKWAVLVAGSRGFQNYRHQADICHAYQILKRGGLKDENIIVFMYDDIAYNEDNPKKGVIINSPNGENVYNGVPKDYTGKNLNVRNLLGVILGDKKAIKGGSGKVVDSGPNDHIFIYYADHGAPGVLTMPDFEDLYADDFIKTLKKKHELGAYKSMVIYVEACEAGSIFEGLLPKEWNIYATTASNSEESSWATYCPGFDVAPPPQYDTCLGDLYSVSWMEDSETHSSQAETLEQQYMVVKKRLTEAGSEGSHEMWFGNTQISKDLCSQYMGTTNTLGRTTFNGAHYNHTHQIVDQHEADILYFKRKVIRAVEGSMEKQKAKKELEYILSHRNHVDSTIKAIGTSLFGGNQGFEMLTNTLRSAGQPIVDDWDCLKSMVGTYEKHCGPLSSYGKKHLRTFAKMCNAGVQQNQMAQASSFVCVETS